MTDYDAFFSRAADAMRESAIRRMGMVLAQDGEIVSFAPGYPAPDTFPWPDLREIAADVLTGDDGTVLQYGPTRGFRPLLEALVEIQERRGIRAGVPQMLVTTGSQQGLDLVARVLLDPGDVALLELPAYTGAITAFRNVQATLVGIRQQADGIDLDDLGAVLRRLRAEGRTVRFLYLVPNFQNPTGLLIGRGKRQRLLEWAARENLLIVEDDPYREIYFEGITDEDLRPLKADDEEGRVVYLSSFSKTLAPGLRVAWLVAPGPVTTKFELAKQAGDLCTGTLDQRLVSEACRRGVLDRQAPVLRAHYQQKRDVMQQALRGQLEDLVSWPAPRGGFFLWVSLPERLDAEAMLARAQANGVIYVAGNAFFVDDGGRHILRLSFAAPTPDRIVEGVTRLATTIKEALAADAPATG